MRENKGVTVRMGGMMEKSADKGLDGDVGKNLRVGFVGQNGNLLRTKAPIAPVSGAARRWRYVYTPISSSFSYTFKIWISLPNLAQQRSTSGSSCAVLRACSEFQ